ncbi:hypothetical protein OCA21_09180 [Bacillus cereus]|nr:hypothetical protein [Bacillus cereus]
MVNKIGIKAVLKVVIGLTKPRDTMKHLGKMELAKDIIKTSGEYEQFELLGIFTQDELEEIKDTTK